MIRLRDVAVLSRDFEETLAKAVDRDFAKTDLGWLSDRNVNFLFILDGFDELLMEGRTSGGLDYFLDQVGRFQEQCARNSEKNHRVLITGRTLALQAIESRMPSNLTRIEIQPMDDELQYQWFKLWAKLIKASDSNLFDIFEDSRWPEGIRELSREPLILYLLSAMYRDEELHLDMLEGAEGAQAKVLIYERTLDWVLTKQRAEGYRREHQAQDSITARDLNPDITELAPDHLRRILQEAGLCVVQSGMEFASIRAIEDRLTQDSAVKAFLEAAQKRLNTDDTPLRNALAAFYLQEGHQGEGSIEFVHKSFGEFLCAERIVNGLIDICQPGRNREYDIDDPAFCWMMYDLLGCHVLTPEIVEYLTALLTKHPEFEAEKLHKRLYDFYWRWSDGEFIDAPPENLPQQKMRQLRERSPDRKEMLGQRQVDIYTGLNATILLFELHRYGLDTNSTNKFQNVHWRKTRCYFHPCRRPDGRAMYYERFAEIIALSSCISRFTFVDVVGFSLARIDLQEAQLESMHLVGVNLSETDLAEADLFMANLSEANLSQANLWGAELSGSNFASANLRWADLEGSNLTGSSLYGADLRGANFSRSKFELTDLSEIRWDEKTNWRGVKGLESSIGVPEALKRQLGLE